MRRLIVAAAVSLASANQPFSWADAQNAMHACTNGSRPLVDKYAYLSTRHPLGNALSGWMHVDGTRTVPPQPIPKRRRGPGPRGPLRHHHPAGAPRKHRDPERARARARAAAARPHHSKWSPRDVAAAIADEVGRNEQKK